MPVTQINLIGRFAIVIDDRHADVSSTSRRLLAFVCLHDRSVARSSVAAAIWPDSTEDRARGNLRAAIWRLGGTTTSVLQMDDQSVALRREVGVDLVGLRPRCLDAIRTHRVDDALGTHPALMEELCSDIDGEWVGLERERWRQLRLHVLVLYLQRLRSLGRSAEFDEVLARARASAPHHEALLAQGQMPVGVRSDPAPFGEVADADRSARERCHRFVHTPHTTSHSKEPSR